MKEFINKLNGFNFNKAMACVLCTSPMGCYNTAVISGEHKARTHYLVACTACGYGPAQAFATETEAVAHWHQYASIQHSPVELI